MGRVADKVALVTGVSDPVAAACARTLAYEGARVAFVDEDSAAAEAALKASKVGQGSGIAISKDIASEDGWQRAIGATTEAFGSLDILVNGPPRFLRKSIDEMTLADLRDLEEHNVVEPWLGMKHAIAAMRTHGGGAIVNLSLDLAKAGAPNAAGNCATAAGVRVMSQAAALECGQNSDGIRVNSVLMGHQAPPEPDEVAAAVVYLASDESRFMTAAEIAVDSGFLAG